MGRPRKREPVKTKTDRHGIGERLLRAGAELFAKRGLHATQVADIAREAGISVGGFYRYYRDKDELYLALVGARFDEYLNELRGLVEGLNADTLRQRFGIIRRVIRRTIEMHVDDPDTFLLWYRHGYGVSAEVNVVVDAFADDVEDLLVALLDRTITVGGALDSETRRLVATSVVGMINTVTYRMIAHDRSDIDEAAEVCTRIAAGGLLALAPIENQAPLLALFRQELARQAAGDSVTAI